MQIAILTMQMGDYCFLHQTGQTRQPRKITPKRRGTFVFRSKNKMRWASELSSPQDFFLLFGWISVFRLRSKVFFL